MKHSCNNLIASCCARLSKVSDATGGGEMNKMRSKTFAEGLTVSSTSIGAHVERCFVGTAQNVANAEFGALRRQCHVVGAMGRGRRMFGR